MVYVLTQTQRKVRKRSHEYEINGSYSIAASSPTNSAKVGSGLIQCRPSGLYGARTAETLATFGHLTFIIIMQSLHL